MSGTEDFTCIDGPALDPATAYRLLSGVVVPRPIAWVTSCNADGLVNAAPFSAYAYVATSPPMLAISIELNALTGALKDTAANMLVTGEFVVNVASESNLDALHCTAAGYASDVSEVEMLSLNLLASRHVKAPRIADTAIQMECRLDRSVSLGNGVNTLYIGEVLAFHLSPRIYDGKRIDAAALNPLSRLGGPFYGTTGQFHERSAATPFSSPP